jgi:hypothetical protein
MVDANAKHDKQIRLRGRRMWREAGSPKGREGEYIELNARAAGVQRPPERRGVAQPRGGAPAVARDGRASGRSGTPIELHADDCSAGLALFLAVLGAFLGSGVTMCHTLLAPAGCPSACAAGRIHLRGRDATCACRLQPNYGSTLSGP